MFDDVDPPNGAKGATKFFKTPMEREGAGYCASPQRGR